MIWEKALFKACVITTLLFISPAFSSDESVVVNMMIDLELCPSSHLIFLDANKDSNATILSDLSSEQKIDLEWDSRTKLLNEVERNSLNVTIYPTGDYTKEKVGEYSYELSIAYLSNLPNYEMSLQGMTTDEKLGNMSYSEQDLLIAESKMNIEDAHICGGKERKPIKGFRPQSFSQNNDTRQILDHRSFLYNAGYQDGLIYEPGHENDAWPYAVKDHLFYAVPVSTHLSDGKLIPMEDRFALENNLTGTQWKELLIDEYKECSEKDEPMVVIFHNFVIGLNEDYFNAYKDFVDYSVSKNAKFVTTQKLVETKS